MSSCKLNGTLGNPNHEPSEYRSIVGELKHRTFLRLEIYYVI